MAKKTAPRISLPITRNVSSQGALDMLEALVFSKHVSAHLLRIKAELSLHYTHNSSDGSIKFEQGIDPENMPRFKSLKPRIASLVGIIYPSCEPESLVQARFYLQAPSTYLKKLDLNDANHLSMFEFDITPHYTFSITPRLVKDKQVHAVSLFNGNHKESLLGLSSNCKITQKDYRTVLASYERWNRDTLDPLARELFG